MHCVDEAMVPYSDCHGCKQFIHGRPIRYGYKLWVEATRLGYNNWFEPYKGAATNISIQYAAYRVGPSVVLEYADVLKKRYSSRIWSIYITQVWQMRPKFESL